MAIAVTRDALGAMRRAAEVADPLEACGILLGDDTCISAFVETTNVHPAPETHFEIDPQALIDAHRAARTGGPQIVGYFHSHPNGPTEPSDTDRACAAGDGSIWAIAGSRGVRFFRSGESGFTALCTNVIQG
ncbi:MAG: M67 family metallopeptidase [Pseudomonadota bacterium]